MTADPTTTLAAEALRHIAEVSLPKCRVYCSCGWAEVAGDSAFAARAHAAHVAEHQLAVLAQEGWAVVREDDEWMGCCENCGGDCARNRRLFE